MTLSIHIPADLEQRLLKEAAKRGIAPDEVAKRLLDAHLPGTAQGPQAAPEIDQVLDEFFASNPETLPPLAADFSREDIYADHD